MPSVPPLAPHTIGLLLQYISPPSQLTQTLPPHLLSTALSQRHHFLNITPENAQEYLCWPASTNNSQEHSAIDVLEYLPKPVDDDPSALPTAPVRYTADDEHVYAHATLTAPNLHSVRLIFQWDGADSWRYHDASTAPISQSDSTDSPVAALLKVEGSSSVVGRTNHAQTTEYDDAPEYRGDSAYDEDAGDYDYWNSYGGGDVDDEPSHRRSLSSRKHSNSNLKGEDAYWAQYGTVHGTADSTIPSPAPEKAGRKPFWAARGSASGRVSQGHSSRAPSRGDHHHHQHHEDFLPEHNGGRDHRHPQDELRGAITIPAGSTFARKPSPKDGSPPSADTLRELLEAIPARRESSDGHAAWQSARAQPSFIESDVGSPFLNGFDSPQVKDPINARVNNTHAASDVRANTNAEKHAAPIINGFTNGTVDGVANGWKNGTNGLVEHDSGPPVADAGLKDALSGIYALWKATRPKGSSQDSGAFLEFAKGVVEQ